MNVSEARRSGLVPSCCARLRLRWMNKQVHSTRDFVRPPKKRRVRLAKSTVGFWNALVLGEQFQTNAYGPKLGLCLVSNRVNWSTGRKTSGVSHSITSLGGPSVGGTSADPACGTMLCAGSKLLDSRKLEASIRARPEVGHSSTLSASEQDASRYRLRLRWQG